MNNPQSKPLPKRSEIQSGMAVRIIEKHNQASGALTEGAVLHLLTSSPSHPHGIKVLLVDGRVGRVFCKIKTALPQIS